MIHGRLRRRKGGGDHEGGGNDQREDAEVLEIEPGELTGVFAAPRWVRDLGMMSWLLVGVAAFLAGAVWLLALTQTIVLPVITAAILAAVLSPVVAWLEHRRVRRGLGTAIVFLLIVVLGALVFLMVVAGISSQADELTSNLESAADEIQGWLEDLGVEGLTGVWKATNDQDRVLVEKAQRGVTDPAYVPGPYALVEDDVESFINWYVGRLHDYLTPHRENAERLGHLNAVANQ